MSLSIDLVLLWIFLEEFFIFHFIDLLELFSTQVQVLLWTVDTFGTALFKGLIWVFCGHWAIIIVWNLPVVVNLGFLILISLLVCCFGQSLHLLNITRFIIMVIPIDEAKSEHAWLLTLENLRDLNAIMVSSVGQAINVLINTFVGTVLLELIGLCTDPDVNCLEIVNDVNITLQQVLLSQARDLFHAHAATRVRNLK